MKNLKKKQYVSQESSNQSFQLQLHQMKKLGLKKNMKKMTEGLWSLQENRIYLQFLINNQQDFKTQSMRRKSKVFYRISKLLKKRTPDQCRSHHQKLFNKNKRNYKKLIEQLIEKTANSQKDSLLILERKGLSKTVQIQIINFKEKERKSMMIQQQSYEIIHKQKGLEIVIKLDNIKSW